MIDNNLPLISIITVVYNGEQYLQETIESVLNQNYDNIEYIIIDGGSTDGTIDIIKKYEDKIDYWISEKDRGIYDAMNKGIDVANGGWINFMNAGDSFYDNKVVFNIFKNNIEECIIYGNTNVIYDDDYSKIKKVDFNFIKGMPFSHQSVFTCSKILKQYKYNIKYKIYADFDFYLKCYKNNISFYYVDIIVSNYLNNGVSSVLDISQEIEKNMIIKKYLNVNSMLLFKNLVIKVIKGYFKLLLPLNIVRNIQMNKGEI